ncbi:hypothetical protein DV737_g1768, partial [Chaetothyriales sp. CBS 132003]
MYHSGIGGGGFMLVRSPNGTYEFIDFRETAPAAAFQEMYNNNSDASLFGGLARWASNPSTPMELTVYSGVPGEVRGLQYLHEHYGKLPWKTVMAGAINVARFGWPVMPDLVRYMASAIQSANPPGYNFLVKEPAWALDFAPNGTLVGLGDTITRKRYADTLETIANEGPDALYSGAIAATMIQTLQANNGTMTLQDLANYTVAIRPPANITYRGYRLHSCAAPTSGEVVLSTLKILEGYTDFFTSEDKVNLSTHRMDEAIRFGYGERTDLGDPLFVANLSRYQDEMLSDETAAEIRRKISDHHTLNVSNYDPKGIESLNTPGTSHVVTADANGLAISLTTTINTFFGSQIIIPETGIIMNNEMNDFSIPGVSNAFGYIPSPSNYIRPGKRPLSSTSPTIVEFPNGTLYYVIGAAGGSRIITSTIQNLIHILDQNLTVPEALAQPRLHDQLIPNRVSFEYAYDNETVAFMKSLGHNVTWVAPGQSSAQGIRRLPNGTFEAAGEPRQLNSGGFTVLSMAGRSHSEDGEASDTPPASQPDNQPSEKSGFEQSQQPKDRLVRTEVEKQETLVIHPEESNGADVSSTEKDPNIVDWESDADPRRPLNWPKGKKWGVLAIVSAITFLTPLASSMVAPGVPLIMEEFNTTNQTIGSFIVSIYVLGYAIGPLLLAPMSELYGRLPVYHICNIFFLIWTLACALAPNMGSLLAFRLFAGIAGSCPITIGGGSVADVFVATERGGAMAIFALGPLFGPVIGPVAGGFLSEAAGWRWTFWLILIAGGVFTVAGFFLLRETYEAVLLEKLTQQLRKDTGNQELRSRLDSGLSPRQFFIRSIVRPTKMLLLSPIVLIFSTYMAIVYGYLYLLFTTLTDVFESRYHFSQGSVGLTFLGIGIGCLIGLVIFGGTSDRLIKQMAEKSGKMKLEYRLLPLIPGSFLVPAGLFMYGWSAQYGVQWIVPILGTGLVGMGLLATFMSIQTYMVDVFTVYAASAIAANTVLRSLMGAFLPLAGPSMYDAMGLGWGNSLLGFIATAMVPVTYLFYKYGEKIRTHPRFQRLEALLEQFTESSTGTDKQNEVQIQPQEPRPISTVSMPTIATGEGRNVDDYDSSPKYMELPPFQQVLPLVHIYLEKFNTVLPLFNAETLLRLVHHTYNIRPQYRDPVAWAAVNIVLALAHRQGLVGSSDTKHSIEYLARAQSVLSDVALRDIELLNIQVLVGMVMLMRGSQDLQPSLILIATTMRLAHKIGLHNRTSSAHLDPVLARERACVFWMAYILDKDLSLRAKQPSVQLDDDIDLDLPYPQIKEYGMDGKAQIDAAGAGIGTIVTADGTMKMDYFVTRIQLAVIEGGLYDYLYSTRSQKRSPEERSGALESVARALEHWKASIPPEFRGIEVLKRAPPDMLRFFYELDATSLLITGCSYMTAMMLLTANSMLKPQHDKFALDKQLVDAGMRLLDRMVEETGSEPLRYIEPYPGNGMFKSFTKTWHNKPYPQISPGRPELSAAGKIVFITGGGTGIGKATAIAFAQAGAKAIAIFGRRVDRLKSAAEEIRNANPKGTTSVVFEAVNLSQRAAVDTAFASAVDKVGRAKVDVFISNAAILPTAGPVAPYEEKDLYKGLELNIGSAFNAIGAVFPLLAPGAKVLNISSGIGHIDVVPGLWLYAMTKAATTKMFDYFQAENPDLHVFNVQPGVVTTELNSGSGFDGQDDVELPGQFHVWLASPEAEFLKGKFVWVNWDVDELKARAEELKKSQLLKVLLNGVPM